MLLFHEVCNKYKIYLLKDGLKLEKGFLNKFDLMQEMVLLVDLSFYSLGCLYDKESNRE